MVEQRFLEAIVKVLAIEQEVSGKSSADYATYLQAEATHVWELYKAGVVRELYFHAEDHIAVLMLECTDVEEASRTLAGFPLVEAGLIHFRIIPLSPYDGFSRLFADHG